MENYQKTTCIYSLCIVLLANLVVAQDTVETNQFSPDFYSQLIQSDGPVAYWRMDLDERGMMRNAIKEHAELSGLLVGEVNQQTVHRRRRIRNSVMLKMLLWKYQMQLV